MPDEASFVGAFERLVTVAEPLLQLPAAPDRLRCYAALGNLSVLESALGRGVQVKDLRQWTVLVRDVLERRSYLDRVVAGINAMMSVRLNHGISIGRDESQFEPDLVRAATLPASWYIDPATNEREQGRIFRRTW